MTELLTPQEVAAWLKVSVRTVRHLTRTRQLRAIYVGRLPRYKVRDVEAYIAHRDAA